MTDEHTESGAAVLDHLGDDVSRAILSACAVDARSVGELADRCGVSEATIYRRLNRLMSAGLLDEHTRIDSKAVSGGKEYTTAVEHIDVSLGPDGIEVRTDDPPTDDDGVPTFTVVESDGEGDPVVDLQLRLPENLFSEFLTVWAELNRRAGTEVAPETDGEHLVDSLNAN
ncbi:ArsR/SmtB family transcription factor [Halomarina litorea]|uniref:ArsR/SmtB family transcription factor n=1 Tax=Halomarina litorea TaxID=2961595 RepID=UPI0020C35E08|nr:winged helix-turn-helix domain-containing protein [Halomarina sp. BCD28]